MKKLMFKKVLSIFLAVCLCMGFAPSNVIAETENTLQTEMSATKETITAEDTVKSETQATLRMTDLPENIQSIIPEDKKDASIYLYASEKSVDGELDDAELYTIRTEDPTTGEGKLIVHSTPVKYIDSNGDLKYINTGMEEISTKQLTRSDYLYKNSANSFTVEFANTASKGINFNDAFTLEAKTNALSKAGQLGASDGHGKITYPEAFGSDTKIEYINTEGGIKENIILEKYTGQNRFEFTFRSDTHTPILANNGANILIATKDNLKNIEYRFLSLYAYDSYIPTNEENTSEFRHMNEDLYYELAANTDGSYTVTVVVPEEYLTHPEIVYPVTIDPSMSYVSNPTRAEDTFVDQSTPNSQSNDSLDYIRFGKKNGYKLYGFQKFTTLPNLPSGANISGAYITFTFRNGQNTPTAASGVQMKSRVISSALWSESSVTWNNKPTGSTTKTSSFVYNGSYLSYFNVDLDDEVRDWYSGLLTNYGISFTYSNEDYNDYNSVVSSEGDLDRSPRLTIEYQLTGLSSGEYYYIRNANSGLYLTVLDDSSSVGTGLVQSYFVGSHAQQFRLQYNHARGDYLIAPRCAPDCVVEIENDSPYNDAAVQLGTYPNYGAHTTKRFRFRNNSNGTFEILSYVSDYNSAIVVEGARKTNNTPIIQYTANGTLNSKWYIERVIDVDAARRAFLIGVDAENHNHLTSLNDISSTIEGLGYIPIIESGSFDLSDINYYLDNSKIFVIRSHGRIMLNNDGTELWINEDPYNPVLYKSNGSINSLDLSNLQLAMFMACFTGAGDENALNLPSVAVERGARTAIGFKDEIDCLKTGEWIKDFFGKMEEGYTVKQACDALQECADYKNTPLASPVICGDKNLTLN